MLNKHVFYVYILCIPTHTHVYKCIHICIYIHTHNYIHVRYMILEWSNREGSIRRLMYCFDSFTWLTSSLWPGFYHWQIASDTYLIDLWKRLNKIPYSKKGPGILTLPITDGITSDKSMRINLPHCKIQTSLLFRFLTGKSEIKYIIWYNAWYGIFFK